MYADVKGALEQIDTSWRCFEHNGKNMSKKAVKEVLEYAVMQGWETTDQIPDEIINYAMFINP